MTKNMSIISCLTISDICTRVVSVSPRFRGCRLKRVSRTDSQAGRENVQLKYIYPLIYPKTIAMSIIEEYIREIVNRQGPYQNNINAYMMVGVCVI